MFFGILLMSALPGPFLYAQSSSKAGEYSVKFAFLYNFSKFVEWPASKLPKDDSPFIFGIVGDDPFGEDLEKPILSKPLNGHPVRVQHVQSDGEMRQCNVLFISTSEKKRIGAILAAVRGASVLTVSDTERFCKQGGIINFRIPENKVRFEINSAAAEKEHLKLSSKLLSVALKKSAAESGQ